ncbi:MAG: efflux RND transporter periplasmic adaptor subunit [Sedimentisphaerales bacterium]|nr:efflux RND transporter periplasmic adaptor subunit [Sedimentisphaerales bacterium]
MTTKSKHNNNSIMQKANNLGMALFVFLILSGTILRLSGNLHFGSPNTAGTEDTLTENHAHEDESVPDETLCGEHGFPESLCTLCNPSLIAVFQAKGDWCEEHNLPESQCTICNPGLSQTPSTASDATKDLDVLEEKMCEHGIQTIQCDECRYELGLVKLHPSVSEALIETTIAGNTAKTKTLNLTGQIQLDQTKVVDVVPTAGGRVSKVVKLLGQNVNKGDILAIITSDELGQAKAAFMETQARLNLTTATFEREKGLYEKKVSSEADYLDALNDLRAAEAYYTAAEKRLILLGLDDEQIRAISDEIQDGKFAELVIRTPLSGTIIAQNVTTGALVEPAMSMYRIADLSNVWIWYDLYEKDLGLLHERLSAGRTVKAKVRVKAFEKEEFEGIVDLINNEIDEHTRTVKVRVQVTNDEFKLRPGMFTEAEITLPLEGQVTTVPAGAVLSDENDSFVFQHWKDDLWVRRNIVMGERKGDFVDVLDGIAAGATIVTRGAFMLKSDILREKMGAGCAD